MKVGGNSKARDFLEQQPDWDDRAPIVQRYNSKAAALYRDKISSLALGKSWDISEAQQRISVPSALGGGSMDDKNTRYMSHSNSSFLTVLAVVIRRKKTWELDLVQTVISNLIRKRSRSRKKSFSSVEKLRTHHGLSRFSSS